MNKVYDLIAVGLGPFNLSLACLAEPIETLDSLFLEQRDEFNWHPGLMLDGVTLQTPFMSDLVTLADPTNPYSFLNYAKQQGKLYQFYIRESFFLLREQYNQYCQWAASQLSNIQFGHKVIHSQFDQTKQLYVLTVESAKQTKTLYCRHLVLGTGPSPYYPPAVQAEDTQLCHATEYLYKRDELVNSKSITVIGSGQSAAEVFYDLLCDIKQHNYQLNWVTRAPRFFPLEYTKLTLEMTSPEYVDYFYNLEQATKQELLAKQRNLYKGINSELINQIYDQLYQLDIQGVNRARLLTNSELIKKQGSKLVFRHSEQQAEFSLHSNQVIMATGFSYQLPDFLSGLMNEINWLDNGCFAVERNYSIDKLQRLFVQNAELHSHGFVTPDLGMACYRNSHILRSILGYAPYPVETQIAFQEFGLPDVVNEKQKQIA
ncbi:SidA/IucD/PvdA family monooxygenase [Pseudoalteromonas sp. ACER1]|uniref:lysine N(6)-hydroxylase/L-ornithine N(5)-oxygenase family protein n=1 Tax=unclassified Pseudoalteromonas TaxID=194690 RepID=UPI001F17E58A|nr:MULTISPECIES: SidA/IucD/PvdA family monooxygenase [unclassified Pseudoalteromonas]MCF2846736.1 SidA/IucD/PvdA family monooxygenase [Pseudoalteromonas sp. PAST1]MCO7210237.1 SidA/IucD/PvdA family monooxygenase [Pseudoalteromonas sp. ACER1]